MLSPENVYYRAGSSVAGLQPGTRILWYESSDKTEEVQAIRACSTCEEVVVGDPKRVFRRFQRFGIYEWEHVRRAARSTGRVMAIRFGMTAEFQRGVPLAGLREILGAAAGRKVSVRSPQPVPEAVFREVISRGMSMDGTDTHVDPAGVR